MKCAFDEDRETRFANGAAQVAFAAVGLEFCGEFFCFIPQIDAEQERRYLRGENDDADQTEKIGETIRCGDVGLQRGRLIARQAETADGLGSGTDNSRFGRRTGEDAGNSADVEMEEGSEEQRYR